MKVVIAGGNGFIGAHLRFFFEKRGDELILLSRQPHHVHFWDPETGQIDPSLLDKAEVVINLSGENILGRWSQKKKEAIRDSRLKATQFLSQTLLTRRTLPKLFINASAVGYYGDRGEEILTEESHSGHGFLAEVCRSWEAEALKLQEKKIRVVLCRFGIVLGSDGGALKQMEKAFRTGMGGVLGAGTQYMSWISVDDICEGIDHVIRHPGIEGAVNFVSPTAVTNAEFTKVLGKVLHRPTMVKVPKMALSLLFGEGAEMFLASTHVKPQRLIDTGYLFKDPCLEETLKKHLRINVGSGSDKP